MQKSNPILPLSSTTDPELALALRVSMEEQRQRQEEDARRASDDKGAGASTSGEQGASSATPAAQASDSATTEEAMLEKALAISMSNPEQTKSSASNVPDISAMTEEEQVQYAMQMSLAQAQEGEQPMETDDQKQEEDKKETK